MTIKSIGDEDFMHWQVRDLNTDEVLENVEYANDSTGLYIVRTRYDRGTILRTVKSGGIKLEDKRVETNDPDQLKEAIEAAIEAAEKALVYLEALLAERRKLIEAMTKLAT